MMKYFDIYNAFKKEKSSENEDKMKESIDDINKNSKL